MGAKPARGRTAAKWAPLPPAHADRPWIRRTLSWGASCPVAGRCTPTCPPPKPPAIRRFPSERSGWPRPHVRMIATPCGPPPGMPAGTAVRTWARAVEGRSGGGGNPMRPTPRGPVPWGSTGCRARRPRRPRRGPRTRPPQRVADGGGTPSRRPLPPGRPAPSRRREDQGGRATRPRPTCRSPPTARRTGLPFQASAREGRGRARVGTGIAGSGRAGGPRRAAAESGGRPAPSRHRRPASLQDH